MLRRDLLLRLDLAEDLGADLEVGARLGEPDHPDRFNFPRFFA